jgi:multidrug efflux pump subunit AcrA (membrane-fusion protein)
LAIVAVALVVIAITSLGTSSSSSSAATTRTSTVGKGIVQSTVSGNGTLEPSQKTELSFGASGEVTAIRVKAGQKVTKGEVLAEVDSSSARASLASAEAQLIEAEEAVEAAEEAEEEESEEVAYSGGAETIFADLATEGATTEAEQLAAAEKEAAEKAAAEKAAAEKEAAEKAAAAKEAAKEKAAAEKEAAKGESAGTEKAAKEGSKEGATSGSEASAPTESSTAIESAGTTPSAAESGSSEVSGGGSETGGGATVSLPTAEANLLSAELSVKSARQEVSETTLRAPFSGTIAQVSGSVGETVSGGSSSGGGSEGSALGATGGESSGSSSAFLVIAQLHRLKMEVSFSEADIGKVRKGQIATVSIDSMEGTELAGEVTKVSVLPSESGSVVEYPATIQLTQSAKGVRAGMSASAEVVVEQVKNAVTVPSEAISQVGNGKTVTVEEDGKEVTKTIKTGLEGDETTEVISGLKSGQKLILPEVSVATTTEGSGGEESFGGLPSFGTAGGGAFTPPSGGGFPGGGP